MRRRLAPVARALAATLSACASTAGDNRPAFVVVEDNAVIDNPEMIRRIAVLDDDALLVEEGAGDLYRVRLFPGCLDVTDVMTPVRLRETGVGLDRSSQFIVGGRTCPVRAIEKVERTHRAPAPSPAAAPPAATAPPA